MKQSRKIIASIIVAILLFSCVMSVGVTAADGDRTIYFAPDSNWRSDNARFAAYVWTVDNEYKWIDLTDNDGDGIYEGVIPSGYTKLIFCRLTPDDSHNGWSTTWNQTVDLELPDGGDNFFTITDPWGRDGQSGSGKWSKYDACAHDYGTDCICKKCGKEIFYIIAGNVAKIDGVYMDGDNSTLFVTKWDVADENNRMFYDEESGCYLKIYENVAAGEYHFKVVEDKSWDNGSYGHDGGNCHLKVEDDGSTVVITFKDGKITCASGRVNASNTPDNSETPNDSESNEPEQKLNFFQKIWQAIVNFFMNFFGGRNK